VSYDAATKLYKIEYEDGDGEELEEAELDKLCTKVRRAKYAMGMYVRKEFPPHGWFTGKVISYEPPSKLYKVRYDDGDVEELGEAELEEVLKNARYEVGTKVYKNFQGFGWFHGTVVSYNPKTALYMIEYEDGDKEEMNEKEVQATLERAERKQMAATRNKRKLYKEGTQVEKYFYQHGWYKGKVMSFKDGVYTIKFEQDGEEEDIDEEELSEILKTVKPPKRQRRSVGSKDKSSQGGGGEKKWDPIQIVATCL